MKPQGYLKILGKRHRKILLIKKNVSIKLEKSQTSIDRYLSHRIIDNNLHMGERRLPHYRQDIWEFLFSPVFVDKTVDSNVMSCEDTISVASSPMQFKNELNVVIISLFPFYCTPYKLKRTRNVRKYLGNIA